MAEANYGCDSMLAVLTASSAMHNNKLAKADVTIGYLLPGLKVNNKKVEGEATVFSPFQGKATHGKFEKKGKDETIKALGILTQFSWNGEPTGHISVEFWAVSDLVTHLRSIVDEPEKSIEDFDFVICRLLTDVSKGPAGWTEILFPTTPKSGLTAAFTAMNGSSITIGDVSRSFNKLPGWRIVNMELIPSQKKIQDFEHVIGDKASDKLTAPWGTEVK